MKEGPDGRLTADPDKLAVDPDELAAAVLIAWVRSRGEFSRFDPFLQDGIPFDARIDPWVGHVNVIEDVGRFGASWAWGFLQPRDSHAGVCSVEPESDYAFKAICAPLEAVLTKVGGKVSEAYRMAREECNPKAQNGDAMPKPDKEEQTRILRRKDNRIDAALVEAQGEIHELIEVAEPRSFVQQHISLIDYPGDGWITRREEVFEPAALFMVAFHRYLRGAYRRIRLCESQMCDKKRPGCPAPLFLVGEAHNRKPDTRHCCDACRDWVKAERRDKTLGL